MKVVLTFAVSINPAKPFAHDMTKEGGWKLKSDVKYRFVIDMGSLKRAA